MFIPKVLYQSFSLSEIYHYDENYHRIGSSLVGAQYFGEMRKGYESLSESNRIKSGNNVIHVKCTHFPFSDSKGRDWMSPGKVYYDQQAPNLEAGSAVGWPSSFENYFARMEVSKSVWQQNPDRNYYSLRFDCVYIYDTKPYNSEADQVRRARWSVYYSWYVDKSNNRVQSSLSNNFPQPYRDLINQALVGMKESSPDFTFGTEVSRKGFIMQWVSYFANLNLKVFSTGSWDRDMKGNVTAVIPSSDVAGRALILGEDMIISAQYSPIPYGVYHFNAIRHNAYLAALDNVPQLSENSVSNILEIVGFMKGIIIDHKIEIPRSLQDAWLSYRYQYNTTKADVQEAVHFVHRTMGKDFFGRGFTCYGTVFHQIGDTTLTGRCRITLRQRELKLLEEIWTGLYKYGLSPSFYMIWDMIPYSFIVDWFIPIGDILSDYDKSHMYDRTYDITNIWFSIKYVVEVDGYVFQSYTRWHDEAPPEFNGFYSLENKGTPTDRVIGYRILDAASISIH